MARHVFQTGCPSAEHGDTDPTEFRGEVSVRAPAGMTGCGCWGGRAKGTPMMIGQKRGGPAIAKERQEEKQEKHPWCPVEGKGACWGLSSTEHHHGRTSRLQRSGEEVCRGATPSPEMGRVSQEPGWEGMRGHLAGVPADEGECPEGVWWGGSRWKPLPFPGPYLTLSACWRGQGSLPMKVINAIKQTYREARTLGGSWLPVCPHCLPHPGSTLLFVKVSLSARSPAPGRFSKHVC